MHVGDVSQTRFHGRGIQEGVYSHKVSLIQNAITIQHLLIRSLDLS